MKNTLDLHTHSLFSNHAFSSITENIEQAQKVGLLYLGLSDHQDDPSGTGAKFSNFYYQQIIPNEIDGLRILKGVELNIDDHFEESVKRYKMLPFITYAIASIHGYNYGYKHTADENTKRYLEICKEPFVKILGHIDDGLFPCHFETVIKECKNADKIIELNNFSLSPLTNRKNCVENLHQVLSLCKEYKVPIIMNSDAHIRYEIGRVDEVADFAKKDGFPDELILNYNLALFNKYFINE